MNSFVDGWVRVVRWVEKRMLPRMLGGIAMVGGYAKYGVYDNNVNAAVRAVIERGFKVEAPGGLLVDCPKPRVCLHYVLLPAYVYLTRKLNSTTLVPLTGPQFVSHYKGRKRATYEKAWQSLLAMDAHAEDAKTTSFIKYEKYVVKEEDGLSSSPENWQFTSPRMIQARQPRHLLSAGRYIIPLEGVVYRSINKMFNDTVVMKGLNPLQRGKWISEKWKRFRDPIFIGLDASRFDQHVSAEMLDWEHSIYLSGYEGAERAELATLLSRQINNKGTFFLRDGMVSYSRRGGRMSGDMNTSLGNVLIMSSMMYVYLKSRGFDNENSAFVDDGDDCGVFIERKDQAKFLANLGEWFLDLGFEMTVDEPVDVLEQVVFCQSQPIFTDDGYVMVRQLKCLSKDVMTVRPCYLQTRITYDTYRDAISKGGLAMYGNIPVLHKFYACLGRGVGKIRSLDMDNDDVPWTFRNSTYRSGNVVSAETRASFFRAFGVVPDHQIALEEQYDGVTPCWRTPEVAKAVLTFAHV